MFHQLVIEKINKLTSDASEIIFKIPTNLQNDFRFEPGQYLNIQVEIEGKKVIRSYSICSSSANQSSVSVGVKAISDGYVSKFLNHSIQEGQHIEVSAPMGNFKIIADKSFHLFFAGGSGITPILSMIEHLLRTTNQSIYLLYANGYQNQVMFGEALQQLANQHKDRFAYEPIYTLEPGSQLPTASDIAQKIEKLNHYATGHYYSCGPTGFMKVVEEAIENCNIDKAQFSREYFTAKNEEDRVAANVSIGATEALNKGEKAKVAIKYEGQKFEFECGFNEKILDAALDAGAEPPYSCMVAACCTCRAMVKTGNVEMLDKDSLSQKEIEKGYILSCQALPRSKEIYLDFDA